MRSNLIATIALVAGCGQPPATNGGSSTDPVPTVSSAPEGDRAASATTPPATAAPSASAAPLPPLPALANVRTLLLRLQQGGPSSPKCARSVQYEIELDVAKGALTLHDCEPKPGDEPGASKLVTRSKKLLPEQRKAIEDAYAKLVRAPGGNCAADAAPITLELTMNDGSKESLHEQSCGNPAPDVARGLSDFLRTTASLAFAP